MDLGTSVDSLNQEDIYDLSVWVARKKTGNLVALAMEMGGICGNASESLNTHLRQFGVAFGTALQCFDDIGNTLAIKDPEKQWEDLKAGKPGWIWACAAKHLSRSEFKKFGQAIAQLRNHSPAALEAFFTEHPLREIANREAGVMLEAAYDFLPNDAQVGHVSVLRLLGEQLRHAYTH